MSGVGPGLTLAGIGTIVGELVGPGSSVAPTPIALGMVFAVLLVLGVVFALMARARRLGGLTRRNAPALGALALTAIGGAAILSGYVAAALAIGLAALIRIGVAFVAGRERVRGSESPPPL